MRSSLGEWAVILCANPDGILLGTRGNARGVDLNRNFPSSTWRSDTIKHRWTLECHREVELSSGSAPASEPETAALLSLIYDLDPSVVISVHGPLGVINGSKSWPLTNYLSAQSKLPIEEHLGYETPGSFGTFCDEISLQNVTYELPRQSIELLIIRHAAVFVKIMETPASNFISKK
jgi:protein MpaA